MKFQTLTEADASKQIEQQRVERERVTTERRAQADKLKGAVTDAAEKLREAAVATHPIVHLLDGLRRRERELVASAQTAAETVEQTRLQHIAAQEQVRLEKQELAVSIGTLEREVKDSNLSVSSGMEKHLQLVGLRSYREQSWPTRERSLLAAADDAGERIGQAEKTLESKTRELTKIQGEIRSAERELIPLDEKREKCRLAHVAAERMQIEFNS